MPFPNKTKGLRAAIDDDTDFTIRIGDYAVRVHSSVMAETSTFFKKIIDSEGKWKEGEEKEIKLCDDSPFMIARMVQFCYNGSYDYGHNANPSTSTSITIHEMLQLEGTCQQACSETAELYNSAGSPTRVDLEMYVLGDKYDVSGLKAACLTEFRNGSIGTSALLSVRAMEALSLLLDQDKDLKKALGVRLAGKYKEIRTGNAVDRETLRSWLEEDKELQIFVTDTLAGISL